MTVSELAKLMGTSKQDVSQKLQRGSLRSLDPEDVVRYLSWRGSGNSGPAPECPGDMSLKDYAREHGIHLSTLAHRIARGKVPGAHRHGKHWFVNEP